MMLDKEKTAPVAMPFSVFSVFSVYVRNGNHMLMRT